MASLQYFCIYEKKEKKLNFLKTSVTAQQRMGLRIFSGNVFNILNKDLSSIIQKNILELAYCACPISVFLSFSRVLAEFIMYVCWY